MLFGKSPISWKSKRQTAVTRSIVEAEYKSMALAVCEVMWLKQLFKDIGIKRTNNTPIYCENQDAIATFANPVNHEKTKQVDINCHFIRDKTTYGLVHPTYIPSSKQLAVIFTKQLTLSQHIHLLSKLGMQSMPSHLEGEYCKEVNVKSGHMSCLVHCYTACPFTLCHLF